MFTCMSIHYFFTHGSRLNVFVQNMANICLVSFFSTHAQMTHLPLVVVGIIIIIIIRVSFSFFPLCGIISSITFLRLYFTSTYYGLVLRGSDLLKINVCLFVTEGKRQIIDWFFFFSTLLCSAFFFMAKQYTRRCCNVLLFIYSFTKT